MRLVFLHALPLDGHQWDGQREILPGATIAPTLYDFGNTLSAWAVGALDAAGEGPLIVVGNSVGGSCALEMARSAPDRIAALVLIGTKAGHRPEPEFRDRFISSLQNDPDNTVRNWIDGLLSPAVNSEIRQQIHAIASGQSADDLIKGVRAFHSRPDATDVLKSWNKPLVIIHGEHDPIFAGTRARSDANPPTVRTHIIANCGHYVNLEQPSALSAILNDLITVAMPTSASPEGADVG